MSRAVRNGGGAPAGFRSPPLLRLVPLQPEPLEPAEVRWLAEELATWLGTRVEVAPEMAAEDRWRATNESQLRSGAIVDSLIDRYSEGTPAGPAASTWVLAVTAADLRGGGRRFVFGEAAQGGGWAVVGTARFGARGDPHFRERLLKESLHELGHLAGLTHCDDPGCLMSRSADVAEVDRKGTATCSRCRSAEAKSGT